MKVLGLVASHRRLGNTEILIKEALMGAEAEGAEVEILRLTDYEIQACRGDAICLFNTQPCHIQDDFNYLLGRMSESEGIILGTPIYALESTAIIKQFLDRVIFASTFYSKLRGKPVAIISPYATRGWTSYAFLQPNMIFLCLGMNIIHRALIHAQGLREVAFDEKSLNKANNIGRDLVKAIKTGDTTYRGEKGICPVCHDTNIRILKDMETIECGTCAVRGKISLNGNKIEVNFKEEDIKRHRWTKQNMKTHIAYHVKPSRDYFIKTKELRKEKVEKYKHYLQIEREHEASSRDRR